MRGLYDEQKEIITWRDVDMAVFGNLVFWGLILFSIIAVSFKVGKDTGIEQEKQNHNMQFTIDQRKYYESQQKAKSKAQWWQV